LSRSRSARGASHLVSSDSITTRFGSCAARYALGGATQPRSQLFRPVKASLNKAASSISNRKAFMGSGLLNFGVFPRYFFLASFL